MEGPRLRKLRETMEKCLDEMIASASSSSDDLLQQCFPTLYETHAPYLQKLLLDSLLSIKFSSMVRPPWPDQHTGSKAARATYRGRAACSYVHDNLP
jgi:hypothetical protein